LRLPTSADFEALAVAVSGDVALPLAGNSGAVPNASGAISNEVGAKLKSRDGWFKKGNGSDEFRFNALPAGYRSVDGKYDGIGGYAYVWSATEDDEFPESLAYYLFLSFSSDAASLNAFSKADYRSVRCVQ
jgi:uncharacterized protein (TIGR02145 family)